jgi:hypothetical protein
MRPHFSLILMSLFGFGTALSGRADDLPAKLNFDRYKDMLDHSPFAVATAVVAPAAMPNFAKDLYIANAAKSPDGDMVTIASMTDKEFKKYLTTKTPVEGYAISSIEWSDKMGETKVTITKEGQYATLAFNQAELSKPLPNRLPGVVPPPPATSVFQKPAGLATPSPHVRGLIQRNPQGQQASPSSENE